MPVLFTFKSGSVRAEVYGPAVGWEWTRVQYFRFVPSTKKPGQWERRPPDRESDQHDLEKCVVEVRAWYRARGRERKQAWSAS